MFSLSSAYKVLEFPHPTIRTLVMVSDGKFVFITVLSSSQPTYQSNADLYSVNLLFQKSR